jgi:hypothetical protein
MTCSSSDLCPTYTKSIFQGFLFTTISTTHMPAFILLMMARSDLTFQPYRLPGVSTACEIEFLQADN